MGNKVSKQKSNGQQTNLDESIALLYTFSDSVAESDPGSGAIRINNVVYSTATKIIINDDEGSGVDISSIITLLDVGTIVTLRNSDDTTKFVVFSIDDSIVDQTTHFEIPVTFEADGGVNFVSGDLISISFYSSMGTPAGGAFVPTSYIHDVATADADPGDGKQRFDSVTYASITKIFADQLSDNGVDLSKLYNNILRIGDLVYVQQADDATKFVFLEIDAAIIDKTGYFEIPVTFIDEGTGGNIDDTAQVGIIFYRNVSSSPTFDNLTVNGQIDSPIDVLTSSASVDTDCDNGMYHSLLLDDNTTLENPSNAKAGTTHVWFIKQGATGGTMAYGTLFLWEGGLDPVLSTTTGLIDKISADFDGTSWIPNISKGHQ